MARSTLKFHLKQHQHQLYEQQQHQQQQQQNIIINNNSNIKALFKFSDLTKMLGDIWSLS